MLPQMATSPLHDQAQAPASSSPPSIPSSSQHGQDNLHNSVRELKDPKYYIPLYKAALEGDWETAKNFFRLDPNASVARITDGSQTALHIAAMSGQALFVEELVQLMPKDELALQDDEGFTALHSSAMSGKTKTAIALVSKNPDLPLIRSNMGDTPLIPAATLGHKDMVWYLCSVTREEDPPNNSPFRGHDGLHLLKSVIAADFYDVALHLVHHYPELATTIDDSHGAALFVLARRPSAFKSGSRLGFWKRCIYSCIHVEQASIANYHRSGDMENPPPGSRDCAHLTHIYHVLHRLDGLFWNAAKQIVPGIKQVYDTKLMHAQALELVKCICAHVSLLGTQSEMNSLLLFPIMVAAEYGNVEVLTTCIETNPSAFTVKHSETLQTIPHVAIKHRQEKVFNYIKGMGMLTIMAAEVDNEQNNILHQAAMRGPASKLNEVSGAALQMQRELQWYQEVEKIVQPTYREGKNENGEKPKLLFSEEHKDLIEKGEKWMKDMASSSMVVATLIATVVFTAAFTVPGGNNGDSGTPIFLKAKWFMVFAISNALALFSSLTSVLIFLSILTSRYAEEDFIKSLPQKLIMALAMLFVSIAAMMVTFSATHFIMLGHHLASIALIVSLLACVPVTLFAWFQFPLLVEVIRSTYGSNVFNR